MRRNLTVALYPDVYVKLRDIASKKGLMMSEIVRGLIAEFIEKENRSYA